MRQIKQGDTSVVLGDIFIQDTSSSSGAGLTGLTSGSGGLTCYYHINTANSSTVVSLTSMTLGSFTSGGFKEVDATHMPGVYEFCPPDTAFASGQEVMFMFQGATDMAPTPIRVQIVGYDPYSALSTLTQVDITGGSYSLNTDGTGNVKVSSGTAANQIALTSGQVELTAGANTAVATATLGLTDGAENGITPTQALSLLLAALCGKCTVSGSTVIFTDAPTNLTTRINATCDSTGQRTVVSLTPF